MKIDLASRLRLSLQSQGVDALPAASLAELTGHAYDELEKRVGERLAKGFTSSQLVAFDAVLAHGGEKEVQEFVLTNCPSYPDMVSDEIERVVSQMVSQFVGG